MDLKWLEDFVALARLGSFSKAASQRYVTQPAFSRRIRSLELWLGTVLVDRTTNPVELTPAGKELLPHALSIIAEAESVRQDFRLLYGADNSSIRIITSHRLSVTLVPPIVAGFLRSNPGISLSVMPHMQSTEHYGDYANALITGVTDFLITYDHESLIIEKDLSGNLERMEIGTDRIIPVTSPDYTAGLPANWFEDKGVELQYVGYPPHSFTEKIIRPIVDRFEGRLHKVYESPFTGSILAMLLQGIGMSWLPYSVVAEALDAQRLVNLERTDLTAEIRVFIYRRKESTGPVMERFWSHVGTVKQQSAAVSDAGVSPPAASLRPAGRL